MSNLINLMGDRYQTLVSFPPHTTNMLVLLRKEIKK
jgi:hypothetical protein